MKTQNQKKSSILLSEIYLLKRMVENESKQEELSLMNSPEIYVLIGK